MKNAKLVIQTIIITAVIACVIIPQSQTAGGYSATNEYAENITKIESIGLKPVLIKQAEPALIIKEMPSLLEPPAKIPTPPRDLTPM